jgi:hypothetical protein
MVLFCVDNFQMSRNETLRAEALRLIVGGLDPARACVAAGASEVEAAQLLADPAFAEEVRAAEAKAEVALLALAKTKAGAGARWLLERRFPGRYGPGATRATGAPKVPAAPEGEGPAEPDTALGRAQRRRRGVQLAVVGGTGAPR